VTFYADVASFASAWGKRAALVVALLALGLLGFGLSGGASPAAAAQSAGTTGICAVGHRYDGTRLLRSSALAPTVDRRDQAPSAGAVSREEVRLPRHARQWMPISATPIATNSAAVGDDLLKPGPWADGSVLSSAPGKITAAERRGLNTLGEESGCHSCGATTPGTKTGNWVGDHQPVSSGVPAGTPQSLYPQCLSCSNDQGLWIINLIKQGKWPPP